MSMFSKLPVVLVSVPDESTAATVLSELIDNEVTNEYIKEARSTDHVWRLVNKYYCADVRVVALTDDDDDDGREHVDPDSVQAHIIYITADELTESVRRASERAERSRGAWTRCEVRLLLAHEHRADLRAWAGRARAEYVARHCDEEQDALQRVRDALHAHVWPNLVRTDTARRSTSSHIHEASVGDGDAESSEEQRAVEHAEVFAAALDELGRAERSEPCDERSARLDRAEELVLAFCRALGYDPHSD